MDSSQSRADIDHKDWERKMHQALTEDDNEVMRLLRAAGLNCSDDDEEEKEEDEEEKMEVGEEGKEEMVVTNAAVHQPLPLSSLHYALTCAMGVGNLACAKILLEAIAGASEVNTFSRFTYPKPADSAVILYHPIAPAHRKLPSSHLHLAAALGSPALVEMLLARGANRLAVDPLKRTPLHVLIRCSPRESCLTTLTALLRGRPALEVQTYVDTLDRGGLSALHYAVGRGLDDVVRFLLDGCGARVDPCRLPPPKRGGRFWGFSPLHMALMRNNHWAVGRLLEAGADVNILLPILEDPHSVRTMIQVLAGCDCGCGFSPTFHIAPKQAARSLWGDALPPVSLAAMLNDKESITALVRGGVDINEREMAQMTPLCRAVSVAGYRAVSTLLSLGADTSMAYPLQSNLFHIAFIRHVYGCCLSEHHIRVQANFVVLELIRWKVAGLNARNALGRTPLSFACDLGYFATVPILIDRGSSLTSLDNNGRSALYYATDYKDLSLNRLPMKELLFYGAGCLEPEPFHADGTLQMWRSPVLLALSRCDIFSLFLMYKGGALRSRRLMESVRHYCFLPRTSYMWCTPPYRFHFSPDPSPPSGGEGGGATVSAQSQPSPPEPPLDDGLYDEQSMDDSASVFSIQGLESVFGSDQTAWAELLRFCDIPEDEMSLAEHDEGFPEPDSSPEETNSEDHFERSFKRLAGRFLDKLRSEVPSLFDLSRWAVRRAIGDDFHARERAKGTLGLSSALMHQLMIGYTGRVQSSPLAQDSQT